MINRPRSIVMDFFYSKLNTKHTSVGWTVRKWVAPVPYIEKVTGLCPCSK